MQLITMNSFKLKYRTVSLELIPALYRFVLRGRLLCVCDTFGVTRRAVILKRPDRHISGADNQIGKNPELSICSLNFLPLT